MAVKVINVVAQEASSSAQRHDFFLFSLQEEETVSRRESLEYCILRGVAPEKNSCPSKERADIEPCQHLQN